MGNGMWPSLHWNWNLVTWKWKNSHWEWAFGKIRVPPPSALQDPLLKIDPRGPRILLAEVARQREASKLSDCHDNISPVLSTKQKIAYLSVLKQNFTTISLCYVAQGPPYALANFYLPYLSTYVVFKFHKICSKLTKSNKCRPASEHDNFFSLVDKDYAPLTVKLCFHVVSRFPQ